MARTMKEQLRKFCEALPQFVDYLAELQAFFTRKQFFHNHEFKPKRACGLTPVRFTNLLQSVKDFAPARWITWANNDSAHRDIINFKNDAGSSRTLFISSNKLTPAVEQRVRDHTNKLDCIMDHIHDIKDTLKKRTYRSAYKTAPS